MACELSSGPNGWREVGNGQAELAGVAATAKGGGIFCDWLCMHGAVCWHGCLAGAAAHPGLRQRTCCHVDRHDVACPATYRKQDKHQRNQQETRETKHF